ncbi:MAG: bifunctional phosphoribosyl-AMP cyclohydrolase/phosphoribosyl-ATP diphosphatase HisIE [Pyrinomonadaceae bacterium]|nr:bifunctional phosphoribosyl-AMP cyclohydrolase/phosphoribosyl-ATP diphosphatase HisIE [Pyrinomonadaceae bacterium]
MKIVLEDLKFDDQGLIPVVVQDSSTRQVLTLAYMNAESLKITLETRETWFWSRSRSSLWHKGESSGNTQRVDDILVDCDGDALTVLVTPNGPACHTGAQSCFHNDVGYDTSIEKGVEPLLGDVLKDLYELVESRKRERPENSYTTYLFEQGLDKILKKVGEESAETIIAAKNEDPDALVKESADLLYHLMVLLVERGVTLDEVSGELRARSTNPQTEEAV